MESSRIILLALLLSVFTVDCFSATTRCSTKERGNPTGSCQVTCNACRECGPCVCKSGYIRSSKSGDCISEDDCHELHLTWLHAAKYADKKDKFFNCPD